MKGAEKKASIEQRKTQDFILDSFGHYYEIEKIAGPDMLENREFGVIQMGRSMWRHLAFGDRTDLHDFLKKNVPIHIYHSSAYYETPNAPTMEKKNWLGADLIFDLDADHITGTEDMTYSEMLAAVKVEFRKLLDDYLLGDFGFDESEIKLIFSGGRGYHAHVTSESVKALTSHERREIVDFITLPHKDLGQFIDKSVYEVKEFMGHTNVKYSYSVPDENATGWRGKFRRSLMNYLDTAGKKSEEEAKKELEAHTGIGKKMSSEIWKALFSGETGKRGVDIIRRTNSLEAFRNDKTRNRFSVFILERVRGMAGETDEPVTSDVKRLIRLPGSLHGKSSLIVKPIQIDELADFDPLRDCVWPGFKGDDVEVIAQDDEKFDLLGKKWKLDKGREKKLPEDVALFAVCRKICTLA